MSSSSWSDARSSISGFAPSIYYLLNERREEFNQYGIVGRSRQMQEVIHTAELVAESKSTILIYRRDRHRERS